MFWTKRLLNKAKPIPQFWSQEYCQSLKPITPKLKYVEYRNNKLIAMNNIDNDVIDQNSEFMIGSIAKLITTHTILRMQEEKLININDSLGKYIPNNSNNDFTKISVFDVMNHKSGIKFASDKFYKVPFNKYKNATKASDYFIDENLFTTPLGTESYSIIGYVLLGRVIETITQKTYMNLYNQYIFKKFNLNNTFVGNTNITLYQNNKELTEQQVFERYFGGPTGGLYSSVSDLLKFSTMPKYLNDESLGILKKMYFFKESKNNYLLECSGDISGGKSSLTYTYNQNFDVLDIDIKMKTN